jgi:hypothetical protein
MDVVTDVFKKVHTIPKIDKICVKDRFFRERREALCQEF